MAAVLALMQILVTVMRKGGSGKTTINTSLYVRALQAGIRAIIVDLDPQGSALKWARRRALHMNIAPDEIAIATTPSDLGATLSGLAAQGFELVLIDLPGTLGPAVDPALAACHLALVPCAPTILDLEEALPTARSIHSFGKDFAYVVTKCPRGDQRASAAEQLLTRLSGQAGQRLYHRVAYQDVMAHGLGVTEQTTDRKAANEFEVLWEWLRQRLALPKEG